MTQYSTWDKKATSLAAEAEREDKEAKAANDKALGLEDGPVGPPTIKAKAERAEFDDHSKQRSDFIEWHKNLEAEVTHKDEDEVVELLGESGKKKGLSIRNSENVRYVVPEESEYIKVKLTCCKNVTLEVRKMLNTHFIEIAKCEELDVVLRVPVSVFQIDGCNKGVRIQYAQRDDVGELYHHTSPGLSLQWGESDFIEVGSDKDVQLLTKLETDSLVTGPVLRDDKSFVKGLPPREQHPSEVRSPDDTEAQKLKAEHFQKKREEGNNLFRANDFLQAAMVYTEAITVDDSVSALWSNRAMCFLKTGQHEKALDDATKSVEIDPKNSKGWFRKGISLHALQRYPEAIPALLEAEKIEPTNTQIQDAIRMAQLKARSQAAAQK